jgi:integrase/recombinase XerD
MSTELIPKLGLHSRPWSLGPASTPRGASSMTYSFARVSAVVELKVEIIFRRKHAGGCACMKRAARSMKWAATTTSFEEYLDAYIAAAGIAGDKKGPLFRAAIGRTGKLSDRPMSRVDAWYMVRRRAADAGMEAAIGNPSAPSASPTTWKTAATSPWRSAMAGHANIKTTQVYYRCSDEVRFSEIERVGI